MRPRRLLLASALALILFLPGCDKLGAVIPGANKADVEAEGKAIGSACRHAGRAIEDCFTLNAKANKAAVFDGWRDMNDYMTKNKIEIVAPVVPRDPPKPATPPPATAAAPAEPAPDAAPAEDEHKPRGKRSRAAGQAADLPRDDASMKVATRDMDRESRGGVRDHGGGYAAGLASSAARTPDRAIDRAPERLADRGTADRNATERASAHERRVDTPVALPVAERPPARVPAVGSSEIERAKSFANTP